MRRNFKAVPNKGIVAATKISAARNFSKGDLDNMINAFEAKVEDLGGSVDDVMTATYVDEGGGFGEPGEKYTDADLKAIWDNDHDDDPSMQEYNSYEDWLRDTKENYLSEVEASTGTSNIMSTDMELDVEDTSDIYMMMNYEPGSIEDGIDGDEIIPICRFRASDLDDAKEQVRVYCEENDLPVESYYADYDNPNFSDLDEEPVYDSVADYAAEFQDADSVEEIDEDLEDVTALEGATDIECSIDLSDDQKELIWEIANRYTTSSPVSGDWDTEIAHEQQAISDELGVSMEEAKEIMMNYLDVPEEDFAATDAFAATDIECYTDPDSEWEMIDKKQVKDSDGFWTDCTLYHNQITGEYGCMFGDTDLYSPESGYFDWEGEDELEAHEWFDSYTGFEDEDDDFYACDNIYSAEEITATREGRNDKYFGQTMAKKYGDMIAEQMLDQTISKRRDLAEEPGGLIYVAHELGIDMWDLLEALEGMCADGRAAEIDDSTYKIVSTQRHPVRTLFYDETRDGI